MLTTRRSESVTSYSDEQKSSGVALLERRAPLTLKDFTETKTFVPSEQESRIGENYSKLMNYDVVDKQDVAEKTKADTIVEEQLEQVASLSLTDDDIKPTSTTLQFGDGEVDKVFDDMQKQKESYRLNGKGKLVMVLYALAVTVILALIVINTGVLASLQGQKAEKQALAQQLSSEVQQLEEQNAYFSSEDFVGEKAQELGMIKGN